MPEWVLQEQKEFKEVFDKNGDGKYVPYSQQKGSGNTQLMSACIACTGSGYSELAAVELCVITAHQIWRTPVATLAQIASVGFHLQSRAISG